MTKSLSKKSAKTKRLQTEGYTPIKMGLVVASLAAVSLVIVAILAMMT